MGDVDPLVLGIILGAVVLIVCVAGYIYWRRNQRPRGMVIEPGKKEYERARATVHGAQYFTPNNENSTDVYIYLLRPDGQHGYKVNPVEAKSSLEAQVRAFNLSDEISVAQTDKAIRMLHAKTQTKQEFAMGRRTPDKLGVDDEISFIFRGQTFTIPVITSEPSFP